MCCICICICCWYTICCAYICCIDHIIGGIGPAPIDICGDGIDAGPAIIGIAAAAPIEASWTRSSPIACAICSCCWAAIIME